MKTLDYIHLDAVAAGKVVEATFAVSIGTLRDTVSLFSTASSKICITMPLKR